MKMKKTFEQMYKKEKKYFGIKPNTIVKTILKYKTKGNVLDLGTGEGRDVIFLAKRGFKVTGVDISPTGINRLIEDAKKEKVHINAKVKNIKNLKLRKNYDVILCLNVLQFLDKKDVYDLIPKIRKITKNNGLNIIEVFNENNPNKNFPYLFKKNELKKAYKNWNILEYKEYITPIEKHGKNGKPHRHGISSIIAKKLK